MILVVGQRVGSKTEFGKAFSNLIIIQRHFYPSSFTRGKKLTFDYNLQNELVFHIHYLFEYSLVPYILYIYSLNSYREIIRIFKINFIQHVNNNC